MKTKHLLLHLLNRNHEATKSRAQKSNPYLADDLSQTCVTLLRPVILWYFIALKLHRTPLLGVTILYAVLWFYCNELMFDCQQAIHFSLLMA